MPRFAANLSFNPLEPLKPSTANSVVVVTAPTSRSSDTNTSSTSNIRTTIPPSGEVPAVQFDWNSSGLVNPLDGMIRKIVFKLN